MHESDSSEGQHSQEDEASLDDLTRQPHPSEMGSVVPVDKRFERSGPLKRAKQITAITALAAAVAVTGVRESRVKHDSDPRELAGNGDNEEDLCGLNTFALDAEPEDFAEPGERECTFPPGSDGEKRIVGHPIIDTDGKPRDCFLQPVWLPDALVKIRGEVSGRIEIPGRIVLEKGKLCVMMNHENDPEDAELIVRGDASLRISTTGKVLVKMLDPEPDRDEATDNVLRYVMVTPVMGEVLIVQQGRDEQIHLNEGDHPVKIPIDRLAMDGGCFIARPGQIGKNSENGENGNGSNGELILTAAALFLLITRRKR